MLEIDEADDQVIMTTFQAGLNNPNLIFSLRKTPPTTMTNLLFKAQKYMNWKDALTANGIDGTQKIEEIDELQHKKKEKKDCSPKLKEWQRKYAGSYKIIKYSRRGTHYLESLNGKQLPHPWNVGQDRKSVV